MNVGKSNIIIYSTEDGLANIETIFDGDTVWLSKAQMAELFQRDRSVISKHIKNIEELQAAPSVLMEILGRYSNRYKAVALTILDLTKQFTREQKYI